MVKNGEKGNFSVMDAIKSEWSPLRNLEKRIIRSRGIGMECQRNHFKGNRPSAYLSEVPLQVFFGETSPDQKNRISDRLRGGYRKRGERDKRGIKIFDFII